MMDMKNTGVTMSLLNYERLKECQRDHKELINEIKSLIKPAHTEENTVQITIDRERLEKLVFRFAADDLELKHLDHTQVAFLYE